MADWKAGIKPISPKYKVTMARMGLGQPTRYTGNAPTNQPVGVVHGQEVVISQPMVQSLGGAKAVERMLAEKMQAAGAPGYQGGTGGNPLGGLPDIWDVVKKPNVDTNPYNGLGEIGRASCRERV